VLEEVMSIGQVLICYLQSSAVTVHL